MGGSPRLRQYSSHAHRRRLSRAQQPGRAQRRRGVRGSARLRQYNFTHAEEGQAERSSKSERSGKRGPGVFPDYNTTQLTRTPKKAKPSAAARPSAVDKGESGPPLAATPQLAHAPKKPNAATTPRNEGTIRLHQQPIRSQCKKQAQRDLLPERQNFVCYCYDFSSEQGANAVPEKI